MNKELREKFNNSFKQDSYNNFIADINKITGNRLDFKVCETPLFLDSDLTKELITACDDIINSIRTPEFEKLSRNAIPEKLYVPNEDSHPVFLQIDFGIAENDDGKLIPQLIELQGFPSLYAYQAFLERKVREHFYIPENYTAYYNDLNFDTYIDLLKKTILEDEDPENVILLEIEPEIQKTRIDFYLTEKFIGIKSVCVSDIVKQGNNLFYRNKNHLIPIKRIYNRVIFDELLNKNLDLDFSFSDQLNVNWVGHPNWFYKISKFSLPLIKSRFNPECFYLSELSQYPTNLEDFVLKPLFSFAGSGVKIDIDRQELDNLDDKSNYILQKKVEYIPLIQTPEGKSKAEIRMMFIWNDKPMLVNNLLRSSKGKMMGVDFNKDQSWIGSNTIFHPANIC